MKGYNSGRNFREPRTCEVRRISLPKLFGNSEQPQYWHFHESTRRVRGLFCRRTPAKTYGRDATLTIFQTVSPGTSVSKLENATLWGMCPMALTRDAR
jgi:hypothetical protein